MVGEVGWTQELESALPYLTKLEELRALGLLAGSLFWSMMGHAQLYGHVTHRYRHVAQQLVEEIP